jgi:hypothetical protein
MTGPAALISIALAGQHATQMPHLSQRFVSIWGSVQLVIMW